MPNHILIRLRSELEGSDRCFIQSGKCRFRWSVRAPENDAQGRLSCLTFVFPDAMERQTLAPCSVPFFEDSLKRHPLVGKMHDM